MPSYLLKVTKSLGKISHFEFLVMTEKHIFAYKLQPLSKSWDPIKHPLFKKFGWRLTPPPPAERGGRCTLCNTIEFSGSLAKVTAITCKRYFFQIFDWLMEFAIPHKSWTQHHRSKSEYLKKYNLLQHWWKNRAST